MSPVQSSLYIFHEFVVEYLFEVSGILALSLLFYHLLPHTAYSEEEDDDNEEDDDEKEKELDEMTFEERLDYIETTLSNQLELMQKLNHIEHISEQIEAEKAKGNVLARIETVEQKNLCTNLTLPVSTIFVNRSTLTSNPVVVSRNGHTLSKKSEGCGAPWTMKRRKCTRKIDYFL